MTSLNRSLALLLLVAIALHVNAAPQQPAVVNPDVAATIDEIFNTQPSAPNVRPVTRTTTRRPSAGTIVVGEPLDPNQTKMTFNSTSGQGQCNCVVYHMCDPATKTVTDSSADDSFDGFGLIDLRFNSNDPVCDHYLDVCCGPSNGPIAMDTFTPRPPVETQPARSTGCGIRNVGGIDFNITGALDNEANFGEFPWTVALLHSNNFSYFCAGSLIHPRVVLTAVHCVNTKTVGGILARAGEWDSQTTRERLPYQERSVQRVILHPQFNPRNVANNFALLIVSEAYTLDDHINTVCLPSQSASPVPRTTCFSTGWGKDNFGDAGTYSVIMKRVPLPIVEFGTCQSLLRGTRLGQKFVLDRSFVCAGGVRGVDTCQGDGGAPLACPIGITAENRYQQSGIVSWGIGCNDDIPAAYADVATARNWIDGQMLANGFDTASYTAI